MFKQLKRAPVSLALALVIAGFALFPGAANAASSPSWKNCGLFPYERESNRYVLTEARAVKCKEARRVMRIIALRPSQRYCSDAATCHVSGFTCRIDTFRDKLVCVRDEKPRERIRARGVTRR